MDNFIQFLKIGAIVLAVVAIIGLGFYFMSKGKGTANDAANQYTDMMDDYSQIEITQYDNMSCTGEQVTGIISKAIAEGAEYKVVVITKAGAATGVTYGSASSGLAADTPYAITQKTNTEYINPTGNFLAKVTKNSNNIVSEIRFTQQ